MTATLEELRLRHGPGERRTLAARLDVRADNGTGRTVRGHAAVFSSPTPIGDAFTEEVAPGAFSRCLTRSNTDALLLYNHETGAVLARQSAGTLELSEDERGLAFQAELARTSLADDVLELVRSRHIAGCSFGFTVKRDEWSERGGVPHRRIVEIGQLFECSLTPLPAYQGTDATAGRARARLAELRAASVSTRGRLKVREPAPYDPAGPYAHSFFLDLAAVTMAQARQRQAAADPGLRGVKLADPRPPAPGVDRDPERAAARLRSLHERRDITTTATDGGGFVDPTPGHLAELFVGAARARGVIADALGSRPLPEKGMTLTVPVATTGLAAAVQAAELDPFEQTDVVEDATPVPIITIAGTQDLSLQLAERSEPRVLDAMIAAEVGAAVASVLDSQIVSGAGSGGELTGLLTVSGATAQEWTDGSPTAGELHAEVMELAATMHAALGDPPDVALLAARRAWWLEAWRSTTDGVRSPAAWPFQTVASASISTVAGSGTNEDRLILVRRDRIGLFTSPVRLHVDASTLSLPGTMRAVGTRYAALAVLGPSAGSVGYLHGSGLATPSWT